VELYILAKEFKGRAADPHEEPEPETEPEDASGA
jgi:hypothetical protein